MPKNTNNTIGDHVEQRETKVARLRNALEQGERSGVAESYSLDRLLRKLDNERGQ